MENTETIEKVDFDLASSDGNGFDDCDCFYCHGDEGYWSY